MVVVYRKARWSIAIYGREHGEPHFHITGPEFRCSVAINSLELIIGTAPAPVLRDALAWARLNRLALLQRWRELNG